MVDMSMIVEVIDCPTAVVHQPLHCVANWQKCLHDVSATLGLSLGVCGGGALLEAAYALASPQQPCDGW